MDSTFLSCLLFKLKYEANVYLAMKCHLKTNLYICQIMVHFCSKLSFLDNLAKRQGSIDLCFHFYKHYVRKLSGRFSPP